MDDYQFEDAETTAQAGASGQAGAGIRDEGMGRGFADEIFSRKINARFRVFFVDLKESANGKFVKISEKSRGRKSTVMMDAEDVAPIIEALQEVQKRL